MNNSIKDKQDTINSIIRGIAYTVFYNKGDYKFTSAYEKLHNRLYLDHKIHIPNRIKDSTMNNVGMFDVIDEDELNLVLKSSIELAKMYEEVMIRKAS